MKTKIIFISVFCLLLTMSSAAFSQSITVSGAPVDYDIYNDEYSFSNEILFHTYNVYIFDGYYIFLTTRFVPDKGDVDAWYILNGYAAFSPYPAEHECPFYNENTCYPPPATGWRYVATGELVEGMVLTGYVTTTNEAPVITLNLLTESLWPPNHKMQKVADISATDDNDGLMLTVDVACNESINGPGDGNTNADWEWDANTGELFLRAERAGGMDGRVYTVTITATDSDDETDTETFQVTVPHDKKGRPKNIGSQFVGDDTAMPEDYQLSQNYPNPFNPTTEITFALPKAETVKLSVYNSNGQLISTLANGFFSEGFHSVMWNATDESGSRVTSGMYVYVLRAGEVILQNKMLLMK